MSLVVAQRSNPAEPAVALQGPWGARKLATARDSPLGSNSPLPHIFVGPEAGGPAFHFLAYLHLQEAVC